MPSGDRVGRRARSFEGGTHDPIDPDRCEVPTNLLRFHDADRVEIKTRQIAVDDMVRVGDGPVAHEDEGRRAVRCDMTHRAMVREPVGSSPSLSSGLSRWL